MIKIEEIVSKKIPGNTSLLITTCYSPIVIDKIKSICDVYYFDAKTKTWEVPCSCLSSLIDNLTLYDDIQLNIAKDEKQISLNQSVNYKTKPFSYQNDGIKWLINHTNGLLLDQPGLGKTLQIIYAAEELKKQRGIHHCLIICGINTLKVNWEKEIAKHSMLDCRVVGKTVKKSGSVSYGSISDRAKELKENINEFFIILNIESLRYKEIVDAISKSKNLFDMVVFDECHKAKNPTSTQGKNLLKLAKIGTYHYGLTGTLLVNSPLDAYVPLKFIGNEHCSYSSFKSMYTVTEQVFGHTQIVGYKNVDTLKNQLNSCSLRRTKDILDLPKKTIIPEYIELNPDHEKFYRDIESGAIEEADRINIKSSTLQGLITRLRQAATCPSTLTTKDIVETKIERAIEIAEEIISNGEKVIIFSMFKDPIYKLAKSLSKYNPLIGTGDVSEEYMSKGIDEFQSNDSNKVYLGTIQKMSTGITLTSASYMILLDSPWTPSEIDQATDRIHRIGTTKPVVIYNLIASNTVDERIKYLVDTKRDVSDYVIDNVDPKTDQLKYILGIK